MPVSQPQKHVFGVMVWSCVCAALSVHCPAQSLLGVSSFSTSAGTEAPGADPEQYKLKTWLEAGLATLGEISAAGQCGLSLNQDSERPWAADMGTVIAVVLLAGGACAAKEERGGTQVTSGHRNRQWDIKIPPISLRLMVWAAHPWAEAQEGFLCLVCLCLPSLLCWVWSGLQENEQCWHVFISNANIATLSALPCCISLCLLAPVCSEIELQRCHHAVTWPGNAVAEEGPLCGPPTNSQQIPTEKRRLETATFGLT